MATPVGAAGAPQVTGSPGLGRGKAAGGTVTAPGTDRPGGGDK